MAAGVWSEVDIAGHPADLFEPSQRNPHGWVLIYLHGVHEARIVDKQPFVDFFEQHGLPVVCPQTRRSWWTDRICEEFDPEISAEKYVVDRVLPFIAEKLEAQPPQIGLFGTSMGGQGSLRLGYKYPDLFPVVSAISPAIDYHKRMQDGEDETLGLMYRDPEQARQDTAILHVHPLNWPRHVWFSCDPIDDRWHDGAERLRMKLASLGIPFECDLETTGGGHGWEYYNTMANTALGFLLERLERERLRVV